MNVLRWALIILGFILIYYVLKGYSSGKRGAGRPSTRPEPGPREEPAEDLVEDAGCGVYFPRSQGVAIFLDGRVLYFHNAECRDKYLRSRTGKTGGS